ncbi:MAG: hypothetical protein JXE07_03235 [Candidatus Aminicenantes bacterium]|nr:hypothetical protein [Candidatus Aminicenantes bacterium]
MFHFFDRFLTEYEGRFEKQHGFLRPIIKEVVERYLDCGNPMFQARHSEIPTALRAS